ncbi:hypothetical protein HYFRA_00002880 [Hymenoscyphus fraxineus]|uniref:LSM2-LSM8 complex subunit LSM8 n=1 Tax=Hymenoscyphus fraxineus TaxID=746836 RepID=A0A9N9KR89_9HELO|nr:hypothetical protein HYFRA_00002880 [Hymenoscyphus fraxineus]
MSISTGVEKKYDISPVSQFRKFRDPVRSQFRPQSAAGDGDIVFKGRWVGVGTLATPRSSVATTRLEPFSDPQARTPVTTSQKSTPPHPKQHNSPQAQAKSYHLTPLKLSRATPLLAAQKKVLVLTSDSRTLVGNLLSCDQMTNLVLSETTERIIRPPEDPEPSSEIPHGLYLIRGDNVVVVGLVDPELDESINWSEVRGAVIGGVKHS